MAAGGKAPLSAAPRHRFDQRGHGQSDQPESGYDLATMAEDLIHGMAALGLGQVALVGHGWGARVALALAARHPALVSHLVNSLIVRMWSRGIGQA